MMMTRVMENEANQLIDGLRKHEEDILNEFKERETSFR